MNEWMEMNKRKWTNEWERMSEWMQVVLVHFLMNEWNEFMNEFTNNEWMFDWKWTNESE